MTENKVKELDLDRRRYRTAESVRYIVHDLTTALDRAQLMDNLGSEFLGERLTELRKYLDKAHHSAELINSMLMLVRNGTAALLLGAAVLVTPADAQDGRYRLHPGMMPYYDAYPSMPGIDGPRTVYLPNGGTITQYPDALPGAPPPPVYTPPEDDDEEEYHHHHRPARPRGLRHVR